MQFGSMELQVPPLRSRASAWRVLLSLVFGLSSLLGSGSPAGVRAASAAGLAAPLADAVSLLQPYGTAVGDAPAVGQSCDDCYRYVDTSALGPGGQGLLWPFHGVAYQGFSISSNGLISFGPGIATGLPRPLPVDPSLGPLIAPFWADVDIRPYPGAGGRPYYRIVTDPTQVGAISTAMVQAWGHDAPSGFVATHAAVVTWDRVGYFNAKTDKLNTFQLVMASDGVATLVAFNYPSGGINWTQASSMAVTETYPRVGFDAGDGSSAFEVAGSGTAQVAGLAAQSNLPTPVAGQFLFRVDAASVVPAGSPQPSYYVAPPPSPTPAPSSTPAPLPGAPRPASAAVLRPYGAAAGDVAALPRCDDCYASFSATNVPPLGKSFVWPFFGSAYSTFWISNNGVISFGAGLSAYTGQAMPTNLGVGPILAVYWADADTRPTTPYAGGKVWYRLVTAAAQLQQLSEDVQREYPGAAGFHATHAAVVTWDKVGYYNQRTDLENTFQAVLISDGQQSYVEFNYPDKGFPAAAAGHPDLAPPGIYWRWGDVSTGVYAQVGFDKGDGVHYHAAPGSMGPDMMDLGQRSNTVPPIAGRLLFRIDGAAISAPPIVDLTPPLVSHQIAGTFGRDGWYISPVTVTWTASDPDSPVATAGCAPVQISSDTTGETLTCTANSQGGRSVDAVTIRRDTLPPTLTFGAPTGPAGGDGWFRGDVSVPYSAQDATSGLAAASPASGAVTIVGEGLALTGSVAVADVAGNAQTFTTAPVRIDRTPPTTTLALSGTGSNPRFSGPVTLALSAVDALSGVAQSSFSLDGGQSWQPYSAASPPVLSDDGDYQVQVRSTDLAGNVEIPAAPISFLIDRTAPVLTGAATTAPNAAGWYRGDVLVAWTCLEQGSGLLGPCPASTVVTGEGSGLSASATVLDQVGNRGVGSLGGLKIDRQPPTTSASAPGGWSNRGVTVVLSAGDNLSGVRETRYAVDGGAPQVGSSVALGAEGVHTLEYWSVDLADNVEAPKTVQVKIDLTSPRVTHALDPRPNAAGWNAAPVTVTFTCVDPPPVGGEASGIASCTAPQSVSADGAAQPVLGTGVDLAGNRTVDTALVSVDQTAPTISAAPDHPANGSGWYAADVTVSFICADGTSGVATCPARLTLHEGAAQSASGTALDAAGNSATATLSLVNVDKSAPTIVASAATADGAPYAAGSWTNQPVTVSFACADQPGLSGLSACSSPVLVGADGQGLSASGNASDWAGNTASVTFGGVNLDRVAPMLVGVPSAAPNGAGWYNGDVRVDWSCTDALSGIAPGSCPGPGTIAGEGVGLTASATVRDRAGNLGSGTSQPVKIDRTAPRTSANAPFGWVNAELTLELTAVDVLSGVRATYFVLDGGAVQTGTRVPVVGEGVHTVEFWSEDQAGNVEPRLTATVRVDKGAPTITHALAPLPNEAGWNNSPVTVSFTCVDPPLATGDPGSGVAACTGQQGVATEGTRQPVDGTARDQAGNQSIDTAYVSLDRTAPTVAASVDRPANADGWYAADVTVSFSCADDRSGVAACPASVRLGQGQGQSASGTAVDGAGNTATASLGGINVDETAPSLSGAPTTAPNAAGWYRADVGVAWTCADAGGSGLAGACPPASVVTGEGTGLSAAASLADRAGNATTTTVGGLKIDRAPPTIAGARTPANAYGWNNGDVVVTFTCSDALSGVAICPGPTTVSTEAASQQVTGRATDAAGNAASATVTGISVDKTAPTVTYGGNAGSYTVDQTVSITCLAADALSGLASSSCRNVDGPAYSFPLGTNRVSATATDRAGNVGNGATSFTVSVDPASLSRLIDQLVTEKGTARSLKSKLDGLAGAEASARAGKIGAFVNHLEAQRGKKIDAATADLLIRLARAL
ncbi:MAG TPA: nidogen-like domain-containing protein [Chloroflexota bacterium]